MRAALLASAATLGLLLAGGAQAAVISTMPATPLALSATPVDISFGNGAAGFAFTSASTGNGPGAAVATLGTGLVTSLFGAVSDFERGSTIDQNGQIYAFSAFPTPSVIPNSAADDFIGLAFTLNDGVHYGYAEMAGTQLIGYGYQSSVGTAIATGAQAVPEPASALFLLAGLAGVTFARRRRAF